MVILGVMRTDCDWSVGGLVVALIPLGAWILNCWGMCKERIILVAGIHRLAIARRIPATFFIAGR